MNDEGSTPAAGAIPSGPDRVSGVDTAEAAAIFGLAGVALRDVEGLLATAKAERARKEAESLRRIADNGFHLERIRNAIARAEHDVAELARDREAKPLLDSERLLLERDLATVELRIRLERLTAERTVIADAIRDLDQQRQQALDELLKRDDPATQQRRVIWQEQRPQIEDRLKELTREREELNKDLGNAKARATALNDRYITRTVAGFLLWSGYGSLAATGAVVAHVFGNGKGLASAGDLLVHSAHDAIVTMHDSGVPPTLGALLLVVALFGVLSALLWTVKRADHELAKFDGSWKEARDGGSVFALPNPNIRRSSYTQLIAALPFVFISGIIISFLGLAGTGQKNVNFVAIMGPVADTFIGTTIGLICTSIMILYVLRAIEPRHGFPPKQIAAKSWRAAWEFYALPGLLLTVIVLTGLVSYVDGDSFEPQWLAFGGFMLLSTIALAYGVVFHGIFKDTVKLKFAIGKYDETIEFLTFGPDSVIADQETQHEYHRLSKDYRFRRERLESLQRSRNIGIALGHEYMDRAEQTELEDYLESQRRFRWLYRRRRTRTPLPFDLKAIDLRNASALVDDFSRLQAMKRQNEERAKAADERAARLAATETNLDRLRDEHAGLTLTAKQFEADHLLELANIEDDEIRERLKVRRAYELGSAARPSFESMRKFDIRGGSQAIPSEDEGGPDGPVH